MLIYLCVNSAFVSIASLDFEVFGGCQKFYNRWKYAHEKIRLFMILPDMLRMRMDGEPGFLREPHSYGMLYAVLHHAIRYDCVSR